MIAPLEKFARTAPTVEVLWREFAGPLRRFFLARLSDRSAADDLVQSVFLKVHMRLDGLRDTSKLQGWIFQIARRALIDHVRGQRASEELSEEMLRAQSAEPDGADVVDLKPALRRMIAALPAAYREALVLTEFQGLSQAELAERQRISLSGAKSRVQRARHLLKRMLDACCRFEFDRRGHVIDAIPRAACCREKPKTRGGRCC